MRRRRHRLLRQGFLNRVSRTGNHPRHKTILSRGYEILDQYWINRMRVYVGRCREVASAP